MVLKCVIVFRLKYSRESDVSCVERSMNYDVTVSAVFLWTGGKIKRSMGGPARRGILVFYFIVM